MRAGIAYAPGDLRLDLHDVAVEGNGLSLTVDAAARRVGDSWAVTASAPGLRFDNEKGASLGTGPLSLAARVAGGAVTVETLELAAPVLRLSSGRDTVRAASFALSGQIGRDSEFSGAISASAIDAAMNGARFQAAVLQATANASERRAALDDVALRGIALHKDDTRLSIAAIRGSGRAAMPGAEIAFTIDALEDLRASLTGDRAIAIPHLTVTGTLNPDGGSVRLDRLKAARANRGAAIALSGPPCA